MKNRCKGTKKKYFDKKVAQLKEYVIFASREKNNKD